MYVCLFVCPQTPSRVLYAASPNLVILGGSPGGTWWVTGMVGFFPLFFLTWNVFAGESVKMTDAKTSGSHH